MGETEPVEDEAYCSHMDNDQNIDTDDALSYFDERIQDVLGQYQKDFEGGISAQNLGARFGGYGSFLPTYQQSPSIWSHSGTPQKGQNNHSHDLPLESAPRNSTLMRPAPASTVLSVPELRNSSVDTLSKVWNSGDCVSSHKPLKLPIDQSDKKSLKFRIKVGLDNILTEKKASIYSNLGLDMSPSSVSEGIPGEWEGVSPDSLGKQGEYPSCIIKIMTSFPIPNGVLLSPLHDSLVCLIEDKNLLDDSRSGPVQKRCPVFKNEVASKIHSIKVLGEKKKKFGDKNSRLVESKNGSYEDPVNSVDTGLKKEGSIMTSTSKEIVSNNLKLPPESNKLSKGSDMADGTGMASEANMGRAKDKFVALNMVKEETLWSMASKTDDKQNAKNSLAGTIQKEKKVGRDLEKGGGTKDDRSLDLFEEHCDMPKGSKVCDWGTVAPAQQNCERKTTCQHDGVEMSHVKDQSLSGGERKSTRSQNYDTAATRKSKDSLRVSSSSESKDTLTYESYFRFKSRGDDKSHKGSRKAKDSLSVTTANKKLAEKECVSDALGIPLKDQAKDFKLEVSEKKSVTFRVKPKEGSGKDLAKDSNLEVSGKIHCAFSYKSKDTSGKDSKDYKFEVFGKGSHAISNKPKETSGKGLAKDYRPEVSEKESYTFSKKLKERSGNKKNFFPSFSEAHLKGHLKNATTLPSSLPTEVAPVVIEENWVCCDKCLKWRLLPYGTNPDHLPKKWLCSMLNWLPGMNSCSFSEEETTNALNSLYQVPVSETQHNQQTYPVGTASGETSVDAQHLNQNCQDLSFTSVAGVGKKKLGANAVLNAAQHGGHMDVLNLKKKNQQVPVKSKGLQNLSQSSLELTLEKRSGDAKPLKTKSRMQSDQDDFRPFKKAKTQSTHYTDIDQDPAGLSMKEAETDIQKYNEIRSIYIKGAPRDGSLPSVKQSKKQVHKTIAGKKRKLKEQQDTQIQLDDLPSNRHHIKDERITMEESSGRECRKEKKARESKFQGKETSSSKASGEPDNNKGKVTKILLSSSKNNPLDSNGSYKGGKSFKNQRLERHDGYNLSEWAVDGNNSSRRDLEVGQPCIPVTSSSSMILGTGKIKLNFHEVKGSPAESVCSSPLRISNSENLTRSLSGKDGDADVGLSLMNSPGRCFVGKGDVGRNESGLVRKEKAFPLVQNGSSGSPLFDYQDELTVHKIHERSKSLTGHSCNILNSHLVSDCIESDKQNDQNFNEPSVKHRFHHMERVDDYYFPNKSLPEKSRNGSSSQAKKRQSTPISEYDQSRIRISKSFNGQEESDHVQYEVENESHDFATYKKDIKVGKIKIHGNKSTKVGNNHAVMRVSAGKCSKDSRKRENRITHDRLENPLWKMDTICPKGGKSVARQNSVQNQNDEKSSKWVCSERTHQVQVAMRNGGVLPADGSDGGDSFKDSQHLGKDDWQNGLHHVSSRHPTSKRHGIRDTVSTSHRRKDNNTHAANSALKEAEDLKHSADRLKISGSGLESTEVCFEAALKFLHGASLLDPCNSKSAKYGDATSTAAYSTTAKLCEYCASEYERCKDMASAALAYKCMEVAHMRIIYSNHFIASSDRHELQTTLQRVSPVESPSSSASDVDDLNNQAMMDKMDVAKDGSSLQVTGNHVIAARNRPKFVRLLNFAEDVDFAMEASRKSQIAFAAADVVLAGTGNGEAISSIRRVLDFSFHDVEELLQLVRLAMEALCSS